MGLLVAVTGAAFLLAFTFFRKGGYSERDTYQVFAYFDDITGLSWKSRVQIAGIQVGEVAAVTLAGTKARLDLRVRKDIDLRANACITKTFPSALLPDALLDATPGTAPSPSLQSLPTDIAASRRDAPPVGRRHRPGLQGEWGALLATPQPYASGGCPKRV